MMTEAERKQMEAYRRSHPWTVHDVANIGRACGRYRTAEAAKAEYHRYVVGVDEARKEVLVCTPVYC
jgi:hypothetical protein